MNPIGLNAYLTTVSIVKMDSIFPDIPDNYLLLWEMLCWWKPHKSWFSKKYYLLATKWLNKRNQHYSFTVQMNRQASIIVPLYQFEDTVVLLGHLVYWLLKHNGYLWNEMTFQSPLLDLRILSVKERNRWKLDTKKNDLHSKTIY